MNELTPLENILNAIGEMLSICFILLVFFEMILDNRFQLKKNTKWMYFKSWLTLLTGLVICIGPWQKGTFLVVIIYTVMGWAFFDRYRTLVATKTQEKNV